MEQSANLLGARLRDLRKQKQLSLKQLSEISGIHFTQLSRYERGVTQPTAEMLRKLAQALNVEPSSLLDDSQEIQHRDPEVRQLLSELEQLPEADKLVVKRLLNAFLFQHRVRCMSA